MIIATLHGFGGPEVLVPGSAPPPTPGPFDVLIDVHAAGVNRADVLQREGRYAPPPGAPAWLGLEVAGVVIEVGADVTEWVVGDEVCALLPGGGYAQLVTVDSGLVLPIPPGLSMVEAAGLVEAACTVWSNFVAADARAGERLLVQGGSGGVGHVAIQVGRALGLEVWATAGSDARVGRCEELGAKGVNYRTQDFVDELAKAGGADVVLDVMGAAYLERNVDALARGGRLVIIGMQGGVRGQLNLGAVLTKHARVMGTTLRPRPLNQRRAIVAGVFENVWPLVPQKVQPIVDVTFPLERAADAHRALERGEVFGKVVLTCK